MTTPNVSATPTAPQCLSIVHFNDLHGHVEKLPQIATLVKYFIEEDKRRGCSTLVLNGGDALSGTYVSYKFKGRAEFEALKKLGANAMVLGNHDFDFGAPALQDDMSTLLPVLSANVYMCKDEKCEPFAKPYTIVQFASLKIAIFGLTHDGTPIMSLPQNVKGLRFDDAEGRARQMMSEIVPISDVQIALTHQGVQDDVSMAAANPLIDAVIGGHDHVQEGAYCKNVRGVPVCQTPANGTFVGRIDLIVRGGKVTTGDTKLYPVDNRVPLDRETAELLTPFVLSAKKEEDVVVGTLAAPMNRSDLVRTTTDAMKTASGADISFMNNSGIRAELPAGKVTYGKIFEACPFDNNVVVGKITGAGIRYLVQKALGGDPKRGPKLVFSGVTYSTKAGTSEVADIMVNGKPLNENGIYTAATIDFLAFGRAGYEELLRQYMVEKVLMPVRNIIVSYIHGR